MKSLVLCSTFLLFMTSCKNAEQEVPIAPPGAGNSFPDEEDPFGKIDNLDVLGADETEVESGEEMIVPTTPGAPVYNFANLTPVVSCVQETAATAGGTDLVVKCTAKGAEDTPFTVGNEPMQLKWSFSHPALKDLNPKITASGPIESPLSAATFAFPGPNNLTAYYLADSGLYSLEMVYTKDPAQIKGTPNTAIMMKGEGCGPVGTLSFQTPTRTYTQIEPSGQVRVFGGGGARYLLGANASLTTDGDNVTFLAPTSGRITDKGMGGTAVIMKATSYVAEGVPKAVYADKAATITAPKEKIFQFKSTLAHCP